MNIGELESLVGHRFAGGRYTVAHWENWLLTDCTGAEQAPERLVHPIALFHVPILGAGTSIAELFGLLRARGAGSVSLILSTINRLGSRMPLTSSESTRSHPDGRVDTPAIQWSIAQ